ncbi:hypothetical protein BDZ88DRAFT_431321 [Geranomyces variabilis]|nr:hypothetical protein BDZ88DRAFT_431321 [Geranomyces variabilis]KAJ3131597.1 hypothetical protein HDU90_008198 [Geranomyces variabilis]
MVSLAAQPPPRRPLLLSATLALARFYYRSRGRLAYFVATTLRTPLYAVLSVIFPTWTRVISPRPGSTVLNCVWLAQVLGVRAVYKAEIEKLDGSRGLVGGVVRVRCWTDEDGNNQEERQKGRTFVLKTSLATTNGRLGTIVAGRVREARLYNAKEGWVPEGTRPRVWYAWASAFFGEYVMLMEDLAGGGDADSRAVDTNMVLGNQIWGVPAAIAARLPEWALATADAGERDAGWLRVLTNMFEGVADMHARWWNDPRLLLAANGFKSAEWYRGSGRIDWELAMDVARRNWARGKVIRAKDGKILLSPKLVAIVDRSLAHADFAHVLAHCRSTPFTLIHGDFHAANQFTVFTSSPSSSSPEECTQRLYDWSEAGPYTPPVDLAQLLISDLPPKFTATHSRELVRAYHARLTHQGIEYSWDECWTAFCEGGIERWIFVFAIMAGWPAVPGPAIAYFQNQVLAFIEAHGDREWYQLKPIVGLL